LNPTNRRGTLGFVIIGVSKLATALMLAAAGFGIFRLMNQDIGEVLQHFATRLHLDPENRVIQEAVSRVSGIDRSQLKALGVGTFFYAILESVEGIGLILKKHWAEYLTVVATALLLPPEIYEIIRKVSALRVAVLLVNVAILIYLIVKLWQGRKGPEPAAAPR
jgi:uncharacterized membrane protein (DUF2068 family)